MIATAYSREIKIIKTIELGINIMGVLAGILLSKQSKRCPAIILAVKRTDRVTGRMILLTVSIRTINDDSAIGVPLGTKWENI